MNIEGEIISVREEEGNIWMNMIIVDKDAWREIYDYAMECCEDIDEQADFYFEFLLQNIEFNVTSWIAEIEKKYFSKGNKMSKFPFQEKFNVFYNPQSICFEILDV